MWRNKKQVDPDSGLEMVGNRDGGLERSEWDSFESLSSKDSIIVLSLEQFDGLKFNDWDSFISKFKKILQRQDWDKATDVVKCQLLGLRLSGQADQALWKWFNEDFDISANFNGLVAGFEERLNHKKDTTLGC